MPRHHHHQIIIIPPTTASTIIFPYNNTLKKFDTNSYNPMMTNGRVSADEINQLLTEAMAPVNEYMDKQLLVKRPWLIIFLIILLPLLYIFLIYQCCTMSRKQKEWEEVKVRVRSILKEKGSHFEQRGLSWVLPVHFPRWIELWTGQGGMQPNMMMQQQMMQQNMMMMQNNGAMMGQNGYNMVPQQQQMGMNNNMMTNQQVGFTQPGNQQMQYGAGMYSNNMNA